MKLTTRVLRLLAASLLLAPSAALAVTIDHGVLAGTNVTFSGPDAGPGLPDECQGGVCETTSSSGDPDVLWGAPSVSGDDLLFTPAAFLAEASGAGGYDYTGSQLQTIITSNGGGFTLDTLNITEFGDATLLALPPPGTGGTGTFVSMAGFVTVTETLSGPITPVVIPFTGSISPSDLLSLPGDFGTTLWSGSVSVDIASVVPDATEVILSLDNDLYAYSDAVGSSAKIQKKVVNGPSVVVSVPEPGMLSMLGSGALVSMLLGRRRRSA
ncbi:MAG: PEP-CTERM sorting domain-containing protein [Myxococcota bacterium]